MRPVRVAADRWNFELVGAGSQPEYITPLGANILDNQHPAQGTLFDRFDADACDRRLGLMAGIGMNCLRQAIGVNHVFDPASGLKAEGMRHWDTFIGLAQKHGVYLMPVGGYIGGNDWFDPELLADSGRALDESCAFWEAFVGHYAGHPAIWAWDLRNELYYSTVPHMVAQGSTDEARIAGRVKDGWAKWLSIRYGTVGAMNRAYSAARFNSFADVPGSIDFEELPFDLRAFDFRCYLNDRGYDWCRRQCDVIRAASPNHMICSGNNTWLFPDMDLLLAHGFHNHAHHDLFDFITHHPYPAPQSVPGGRGDPLNGGPALSYWLSACIGMSRLEFYGKPVVVQEFGWYGGGESRFLCDLPFRSEEEHSRYTETLCNALLPHTNGFLNWPLMDMPAANDISNHGGVFTHDGRPKALARVYEGLADRLRGRRARARGTATLTASLLGLYTSRACQDQLWDDINAVIQAGETPDFRFI